MSAVDLEAQHRHQTFVGCPLHRRLPHPVSVAGMLEMGSTYLPVNHTWPRYIEAAQAVYEEKRAQLLTMLVQLADDASQLVSKQRCVFCRYFLHLEIGF